MTERLSNLINTLKGTVKGLEEIKEEQIAAPPPRFILITRNSPLSIPHNKWTPVPMDNFYGGHEDLYDGRYIKGEPGSWLFGLYARIASNTWGQGMVQFVRDIEGDENSTGAQDWVATPGRDFVTHMWFFSPTVGKSTGFQIMQSSGKDLVLEYAQLKALKLIDPV